MLPVTVQKYDLVHLLITNRCNLGCSHCLANSGSADDGELTTEEMVGAVKQLNEVVYKDIHFEGGEPFFRDDFDLILGSFKTLKNATVITNGTIPYDDRFEVLKEKDVDGVMFSMDNFGRPKWGQYDMVIDNFLSYKNHGLPVKIRSTITRANVDFMEDICNLAVSLGVGIVRFGAYKKIGRGANSGLVDKYAIEKEDYERIFEELARLFSKYSDKLVIKFSAPASFDHRNDGNKIYELARKSPIGGRISLVNCFAFEKQFNIFSNGQVTQCNESCSPVVLGDLHQEKLDTILKNREAFEKGHRCSHGHLLISSDNKSFNMQ